MVSKLTRNSLSCHRFLKIHLPVDCRCSYFICQFKRLGSFFCTVFICHLYIAPYRNVFYHSLRFQTVLLSYHSSPRLLKKSFKSTRSIPTHGIIKSPQQNTYRRDANGIIIDTTHIEANTMKRVTEHMMKQLAKKIFKAMGEEEYEIPDYTQIENHVEAKQVMKDYDQE